MYDSPEKAIGLLRDVSERDFPGCVSSFSLFEFTGPWSHIFGFGIEREGGRTLVRCSAEGLPEGRWSVQVSSGLAIHVPSVNAALAWANARNRGDALGKFYCAIDQEQGRAAVIYESFLHATHFKLLSDQPTGPNAFKLLGGWLRGLLFNSVTVAAGQGAEILGSIGGERFEPGDAGFAAVLMCSSTG